jgi:hypothetical protein
MMTLTNDEQELRWKIVFNDHEQQVLRGLAFDLQRKIRKLEVENVRLHREAKQYETK